MKTGKLWDIFCKVIDNYGDIGVCWRLAVGLGARGEKVRLWLDDASALEWMAPEGDPAVEVRRWSEPIATDSLTMGDILVEAFGCEVAPEFVAAYACATRARRGNGSWINLEYLSAESFAQRSHGLTSPVTGGPGAGLNKYFFYPGFQPGTGGLLREADLLQRQSQFDRNRWLQELGIAFHGEQLVSLFCYEPAALGQLLQHLADNSQPSRLLVTSGRATAAVRACLKSNDLARIGVGAPGNLSVTYLPALTQADFDHLLWACDLNFVRGEDSLVRALWANKPFVWQIYPQHDDAHHKKLDALLDWLQAPPSLRAMHQAWNGVSQDVLPALALPAWSQTVADARSRLLEQNDLVTEIIRFAAKTR